MSKQQQKKWGQRISLALMAWGLGAQLILAQNLDLTWTKPYGQSLEQKESLALLQDPLDQTLTRMELVNWMTQVFKLRPDAKKFVPLTDLTKDSPDYLNAQAFIQAGLGTAPKGKFEPKGDYTRLEAWALFARALKLSAPSAEATEAWIKLYKDGANVAPQGKTFIAAAAQAGLVINVPDAQELGPDFILTRGEGIVLLYQALAYQKKVNPLSPPVAQLKLEAPILSAIEVTPRDKILKSGQTLTITAKGTPGSKGEYSLGDLVTSQALKETQPGIYTATYTVRPDDFLANPAVSVALSRGGQVDRKQKIAVVTLGSPSQANDEDRNASGFADPVPMPIAPRRNTPPANSSALDSGGTGYGTDLTPPAPTRASVSPGLYQPDFRSPGKASDLTSRSTDIVPIITQVGYNGMQGRAFIPGDVLTVTLKGVGGGKAYFRIEGYTADIQMKEESQGFYRATVRIGKNLDIPSGTIRVMLTKEGRQTFESIPEPVSIVSQGSRSPAPAPF